MLLYKTDKNYEFNNLAELASGRGLNSESCGKYVIVLSSLKFLICTPEVSTLCKEGDIGSLRDVSVRFGLEGIIDCVMVMWW